MGLFGTSGIRGDAKKLFTNKFCYDLGRTFIEFSKKHNILGSIALGIDGRFSSPRIKDYVVKGLLTGKVEIFDEGLCPIPAMNWILKATPIRASLMVTGSHVAPNLNGIKFFAFEEEINKEHEREIEEIYAKVKGQQSPPRRQPEVHHETRAQELYKEMLVGLIPDTLPGWRLVIDCANGAQSVVMPEVLSQLGLAVTRVNCQPQDEFIARDTDTDDKAEVELLKKTVLRERANFGIAYDGDGDRVVFIDEKGNFIQGEYSCSLVAKNEDTDTVVTTISSSQVVDRIDKKIVRTKVGSPYVIAAMKKEGSTFGFEPNGGAISAEIMYTRDGGSMTIKLLSLFSQFNGTFSAFIGQLPRFYMKRTKVDLPAARLPPACRTGRDGQGRQVVQEGISQKILSKAKGKFRGEKIEELDGLKIWLDKTTWILFRPSANAPEFRVFAESDKEGKSKELLENGIKLVQNVIAENE